MKLYCEIIQSYAGINTIEQLQSTVVSLICMYMGYTYVVTIMVHYYFFPMAIGIYVAIELQKSVQSPFQTYPPLIRDRITIYSNPRHKAVLLSFLDIFRANSASSCLLLIRYNSTCIIDTYSYVRTYVAGVFQRF